MNCLLRRALSNGGLQHRPSPHKIVPEVITKEQNTQYNRAKYSDAKVKQGNGNVSLTFTTP